MMVLWWLRFWARWQLKKFAPDIIGITGSAGKTSCRNAVLAVLKDKYKVKVSYKANSESGIPLNILGINPKSFTPLDWLRMTILAPIKLITNWQVYEKYIVEMGVDSPMPPKNMEYLLTIVRPRTAIFLNAMAVHTEYYEKKAHKIEDVIQAIAREKGKLIKSLPKNGLAILNTDDPKVWPFKKRTQAVVMGFGKKTGEVVFDSWQVNLEGTTFAFHDQTSESRIHWPHDLLPEHFGYTLAAALCIALDEDFTLNEGCQLIKKNFHLPPGRASMLKGLNGSTIIDSSYNASPSTVADMLALLNLVEGKRKLAILGDMRELGEETDQVHSQALARALRVCDLVYTVGPMMGKNLIAPAKAYTKATAAAEAIKGQLRPGDVLLIKGSQNTILLEAAVARLLADPNDIAKLCRRGRFWDKQRQRYT